MQTIILKIYTGVHLGAQIELTTGTWTFGRDESCDIILTEKNVASRHAALTVTDSGRVSAQPLDGIVAKLGEPKSGVTSLKEGALYTFADVVFAFGPSGADASFWKNVSEDFLKTLKPEAAPVAPAPTAPETPTPASEVSEPSAPTEAPESKPQEATTTKPRSLAPWIVAFTLALLIGAGYQVLHREKPAESSTAVEHDLSQLMAEAGFKSVRVKYDKKGVVLITGSVKNDTERGQLVELSRMLKTPVAIDVTVDDDYTVPLRESFNTLDFWPEVLLEKSKDGTKRLLVAGYMLSSVVEEQAFVKATANVPELAIPSPMNPIRVLRKILHREDIERLAAKAFAEHGVTGTKIEFLPGRLIVKTVHTPEGHLRLDNALKRLGTLAGVPIKIETVNLAEGSLAPTKIDSDKALKASFEKTITTDPMKPTFKVVAVSGGALKFVTLSNGSKYFAGGRMPGGFTLEAISFDRLVLSKNKKKIIYPLRIKK